MKSLLEFLIKNQVLAIFIVLQSFNLFLVIKFNEHQKQIFFNFSNTVSGNIHSVISNFTSYLNLKEKNKKLSKENVYLKNKLEKLKKTKSNISHSFKFINAEVVYLSTSYQNNFIIINKGKTDNIKPNMGVVGPKGIIGVTYKVSKHYTSILSILNTKTGVSAKHKKSNYPCLVKWNGENYRIAQIYDLPTHIQIEKGDSIVTSGFSAIFPKDILIGTISEFSKNENNNFYNIQIKLAEDLKTVSNIKLILNLYKNEFDSLKQVSTNSYE